MEGNDTPSEGNQSLQCHRSKREHALFEELEADRGGQRIETEGERKEYETWASGSTALFPEALAGGGFSHHEARVQPNAHAS